MNRTSIAVLPFANMSGGAEQDYFSDGLTEDLITELSRFRHLSVVARTTIFAYKGLAIDVQEVGRRLGVEFVVEGSARQAGGRVRVTVQLNDAETGKHVWAERFDREITDILAVQEEIVTAIVARLSFNLDAAASEHSRRSPTRSASAYGQFLQARASWRRGDENGALGHLNKAIEIDPNYARALAYLGFFHAYGCFSRSTGLSDLESRQRARELVQRAVAADPDDPFTLHRSAMALLMLGDAALAKRYIELAASLSPRELEVLQARGIITAFCGQHEEGLALLEYAARLEPIVPPGFHITLSDTRYLAGDYAGALSAIDMIVDQPYYTSFCRAACLAQLDRVDEARMAVATGMRTAPENFDPALFARNCASMCALSSDADRWLEGFRKAGIDV